MAGTVKWGEGRHEDIFSNEEQHNLAEFDGYKLSSINLHINLKNITTQGDIKELRKDLMVLQECLNPKCCEDTKVKFVNMEVEQGRRVFTVLSHGIDGFEVGEIIASKDSDPYLNVYLSKSEAEQVIEQRNWTPLAHYWVKYPGFNVYTGVRCASTKVGEFYAQGASGVVRFSDYRKLTSKPPER